MLKVRTDNTYRHEEASARRPYQNITFSDGTAPPRRMNPFVSLSTRTTSAGNSRSISMSSMLWPFQVMPETSIAVMANAKLTDDQKRADDDRIERGT